MSPEDAVRAALVKVFRTYAGFAPVGSDMHAAVSDFVSAIKDSGYEIENPDEREDYER